MQTKFRFAAALALGLALIGGATAVPTAPQAASPKGFDGTWSVQMVTDSGICSRSYTYAIAIYGGNVRYIQEPGDSPTLVAGQVGPDGSVALDITRRGIKVDASGRLQSHAGAGTWKLGLLGCSGRWSAQRRSATQAG